MGLSGLRNARKLCPILLECSKKYMETFLGGLLKGHGIREKNRPGYVVFVFVFHRGPVYAGTLFLDYGVYRVKRTPCVTHRRLQRYVVYLG
jgi:hypothetical protein